MRAKAKKREFRIVDGQEEAKCTICDEWKPTTYEFFGIVGHGDQRTRAMCLICKRKDAREYDRSHYQPHPLPINERIRTINGFAEKQCKICDTWKPDTSNYYAKRRSECKECLGRQNHEYWVAHKEEIKARKQTDEYRERANVVQNTRRQANVEEENRKLREKYANNPVNRLKRLACQNRRHAKKLEVGGNHTAEDVQRQLKAQKGKCYYCDTKVEDAYEVDHIIPLSREGSSNAPWNLVITCRSCNRKKHNKLPHEWHQGNRLL